MRNGDRLRKIALKSLLNDDYKLYKCAKNRVTSYIRKARVNYFKRELHENSNDSKTFWKFMKIFLPSKTKQTVINKITIDGEDALVVKKNRSC